MENGTFYNQNKLKRSRRIKLAAAVFITFFIQNTAGLFPHPVNVPAMLLVPLTVCIGMFEREYFGMFYGLFAGILLDAFSSQSLCYHSIALTCLGFISGLLITGIFRNNLKTCIIFNIAALFLYNTVYYFIYYYCGDIASDEYLYMNIYLPSAMYTLIFTPVFYFIVRSICIKKTTE